jgi:hypothetical protein
MKEKNLMTMRKNEPTHIKKETKHELKQDMKEKNLKKTSGRRRNVH